ncbi:MAG TPA: deoxyribonuclease IV [Firmicutes bacterium]|nr:deoxyribonuclease IV [Bacillota bacterium]HHY97649.1 deoxyribonuclease IV [Bacillota bacterium]
MRFGVHVSIAGGVDKAPDRAIEIGCETMQIFSRSPRSLRTRDLDPEEAGSFMRKIDSTGIFPVVVHIPYLLNLASPKDDLYALSVQALKEDMARSRTLGARYLVIHPGSHLGRGRQEGIRRISEAINEALDSDEGEDIPVILLETVAGSGTEIGGTFEELQEIISKIHDDSRLGICIDTCHLWAAGYDVATIQGLDDTLVHLDRIIGMDRVKVVHANDSVFPRGSHKDRHADIGAGTIGDGGFRVILGNPRLKDLPFILETPRENMEDDRRNLAHMRKLAAEKVS